MKLYQVKIEGESMFVVAAHYMDAIEAGLAKMNPGDEPEDFFEERHVESVALICEDGDLVLPEVPKPPAPQPINFDLRGYVSRNGWHFSVDEDGGVVMRDEDGGTIMVRFEWETWSSAAGCMAHMRRAYIAKRPVEEQPAAQSQTGEI